MRREERRGALVGERVRRVERLRHRRGGKRDELHRALQPDERVGEPVWGAAQPGGQPVCLVLAARREQQVHDRSGDRAEHEQQRSLQEPAEPRQLDDRAREHDGDRLHEHVALSEVGDLVRHDPFELRRRGDAEQPHRDGERRAAARARDPPRAPGDTRRGARTASA